MSDAVPVGGPLRGGDFRALKIPSIALLGPPPTLSGLVANIVGRWFRLPVGELLASSDAETVGGSISSVDKKEVASSSGFVLVIVTNWSRRSFCAACGVPLRSSTYRHIKINCEKRNEHRLMRRPQMRHI